MAELTRFKAFFDADGAFDGIDNLAASLTINSNAETPCYRYKGGDANTTNWPAWTYGNTATKYGTGTAPEFNQGSPLMGDNDDSVLMGGGSPGVHYKDIAVGGPGTKDVVLEAVFKTSPSDTTGTLAVVTNRALTGTKLLDLLYDATNKRIQFRLYDHPTYDLSIYSETDYLLPDTWYHVICFLNRDEASTNGTRIYINGKESGTGVDFSGASAADIDDDQILWLGNAQSYTVYDSNIAYIAQWCRASWHQAGAAGPTEWASIAAERFHKMIGIWPSVSAGTAAPVKAERDSHAYIEKFDNTTKTRSAWKVGQHWLRCGSRPSYYRNLSISTPIKGFNCEHDQANLVPNSNDWTARDGINPGWLLLNVNMEPGRDGPLGPGTAWGAQKNVGPSGCFMYSVGFHTQAYNSLNIDTNFNMYRCSVFAKAGRESWVLMRGIYEDSFAYFDLANGQIGGYSVHEYGAGNYLAMNLDIEGWGDGWWRVSVGCQEPRYDGGATMYLKPAHGFNDDTWDNPTLGDDILFSGCQVDMGTRFTTYFDTPNGLDYEDEFDGRAKEILLYKADDGNIDGATGEANKGKVQFNVHWSQGSTYPQETWISYPSLYPIDYKNWTRQSMQFFSLATATGSQEAVSISTRAVSMEGPDRTKLTLHGKYIGGASAGGALLYLDGTDLEDGHFCSLEWDTNLCRLTYGGEQYTDSDVSVPDVTFTKFGIGIDAALENYAPERFFANNFQIIHNTQVNDITISDLETDNIVADGFDVSVEYIGDDNHDATVTLWYCNHTDSPDCDPVSVGTSQVMTKDIPSGGQYGTTISGLSDDPGDTLNIRVVATDPDGITGSPLNDTVVLLNWPLTVSNLSTSSITSSGFDATIDYGGDVNENATVTLYWCNRSDDAGCDPTAGNAVVMTRDDPSSGEYSASVTGLSYPNSPGDELAISVVAVDPDGVTGSPLTDTVDLLDRDDIEVSNLVATNPTSTSFDVEVDYMYDQNEDATATLWYCNETDDPGCDPVTDGTSLGAGTQTPDPSSDGGLFDWEITGLTTPNDPGDTLSLTVVVADSDGVTGSPLTGSIILSSDAIIVTGCSIEDIEEDGFTLTVEYDYDTDEDATAVAYILNITDNPTGDPVTDGTAYAMTNDGDNDEFTLTITGLPRNNPGHEYDMTVVVTDSDGVNGSPVNTCGTATLLDGVDSVYIPGDNTIATALDAPLLSDLDMGAFFCGQQRVASLQVGNTSTALTLLVKIFAEGANAEIVDDVTFSLDKETWETELNIPQLKPNSVSPTIWIKYEPEEGSVVGEGTFKIVVENQ